MKVCLPGHYFIMQQDLEFGECVELRVRARVKKLEEVPHERSEREVALATLVIESVTRVGEPKP